MPQPKYVLPAGPHAQRLTDFFTANWRRQASRWRPYWEKMATEYTLFNMSHNWDDFYGWRHTRSIQVSFTVNGQF